MNAIRKIGSANRNPYHPDIPLFLVLIPLIAGFNYYLTYTNIRFNAFFAITFTLDVTQGYIAIWGVRTLILYLDRVYPYEKGILRRIILQTITTTFLGLLIISVLTELTSLIARGELVNRNFYTNALFIISIWFFVVNGIYVMLHFYHKWRGFQEQERLIKEGLRVKVGNKDIRLLMDDILGVKVEGEYIVIVDQKKNKYYLDDSLNDMEKKLPPSYFFRLNRQFILHRQAITGFNRLDHGKISAILSISSDFPDQITVSREKAATFKRWFMPEKAPVQG